MGENRLIPIADLLIDGQNPRLSSVDAGQRVSLHDLTQHQGSKLLVLAESIAEHGLNPAEIPIVESDDDHAGRFVVLEGNRRLCAIQILENPAIIKDTVSPAMHKRFTAASRKYLSRHEPGKVLCCILGREEARYWIKLRHTGENEGAGVSSWGPLEQSRFEGSPEPYRELLERLVTEGLISESVARRMPATNFQRIVETSAVRQRLGYQFDSGRVRFIKPWRNISKTLVRVANDLSSGAVNVNKLRSASDRVKYIESLGAKPGRKPGKTPPKGSAGASTPSRARPTLIPNSCKMRVTVNRIKDVEGELRRLPIERYPNSAATMLRVFLELSANHYIEKNKVKVAGQGKLRDKVSATITHMENNGRLTATEARAARTATQSGTVLVTSVTTFNEYLHNIHMSPSPTDLRATWDKIQRLFSEFWP